MFRKRFVERVPGARWFGFEVSGADREYLLAQTNEPCLVRVDTDDDNDWRITQMHNAVLRCRMAPQVDGIVLVPHVTP